MKTLLADQIIDPDLDAHLAIHKNFQKITERHNHDFFEIVMITKGKLIHNINESDHLLTEGHVLLIRPADSHFYKKFDQEPVQLINLAFTASTFQDLLSFLGAGFSKERLMEGRFPPIRQLKRQELDRLTTHVSTCSTLHPSLKTKLKTQLRSLLAEVIIQHFSRSEYEAISFLPQWLARLEVEMTQKENFKKGLPKLYELSCKSPEHVGRTIKKFFRKTPTQWINDFRLDYAANLLIYTDETILTILMESGFENTSHFYHLFQKKFGLTPAKYRQTYSKNVLLG